MRKIICFLIVILSAFASFAQSNINKGNFMVGGQAGFASTKVAGGDESLTTLEFSPNFGYFFINQFAGGIRLSYDRAKYSENDDAVSQFQLAPFLRYYFLPSARKANVFFDAGYGFGSASSGNNSESFNQFSLMAGPAIFLTPSAAMEFALGYTSQGGDAVGPDRLNSFGFKIGFQIHLGGSGSR